MYQKILRTRFISTCPFCGFLHACKHVCACGSPLANSGHTQRQASVNSGIAQLSVWKRKTGVCASLLHHHTHSMHSSEALRPLSLSLLCLLKEDCVLQHVCSTDCVIIILHNGGINVLVVVWIESKLPEVN